MSENEIFGTRFAAERARLGLTQEAVGRKMGRGPQTISNWETGRSYPRTGADYARLDQIGFDVNFLLTGKRLKRTVERAEGRLDKVG